MGINNIKRQVNEIFVFNLEFSNPFFFIADREAISECEVKVKELRKQADYMVGKFRQKKKKR